jgi:hypothetical protein
VNERKGIAMNHRRATMRRRFCVDYLDWRQRKPFPIRVVFLSMR